jgi:protein-S-isoprenylcysteine O-methyltransferase Ste14
MTALEVISRIRFEEALMREFFGDQYRDYMNTTGRLFPKNLMSLRER